MSNYHGRKYGSLATVTETTYYQDNPSTNTSTSTYVTVGRRPDIKADSIATNTAGQESIQLSIPPPKLVRETPTVFDK